MTSNNITAAQVETREVLKNSFVWMTLGLILTAIVAWLVGQSSSIMDIATARPVTSLVALGVWAILGLGFGWLVRHIPFLVGVILFLLYSAFTGLTLSWIFQVYTDATILYALGSVVGLFVVISLFALLTKIDLTRWWVYILFALLGLLIAGVLNLLLFRSETLNFLFSVAGVIIFSISTGASVQKIAKMEAELAPRLHNRAAIIGAMMLYTNFINLFLRLLEIYARAQEQGKEKESQAK